MTDAISCFLILFVNTWLSKKEIFSELLDPTKKIILVTGHRRESFGKGFEEICRALSVIAKNHPEFQIIYPVHMNPNVKDVVYEALKRSAERVEEDPRFLWGF